MTGEDPRFAAAVRVAGALAEAGVTRLRVRRGGEWSEHRARETDLPGLLSALRPGDTAEADGWRVEVGERGPTLRRA